MKHERPSLVAGVTTILTILLATAPGQACTIGVATGRATVDGRPLLWKVRDQPAAPNNEVFFNDELGYRFVAVVNADGEPLSSAWMGVNEHGFAIINANVEDLATRGNGEFMRDALAGCRSVPEFAAHLDATNGSRATHANFAVIDSAGAAFVFEASPDTFWSYDADATARGFVVRTNFACNDTAGVGIDGRAGEERFVRAMGLVADLAVGNQLGKDNLLRLLARDFSDWACRPIEVPCHACGAPDSLYGAIETFFSICGDNTVSAAVVHGVAPEASEAAWLTTLWVQLGQPACTLAAPYWPVGPTPAVADGDTTAPLCDLAAANRAAAFHYVSHRRLIDSFYLRDDLGGGLWSLLLPAETEILATVDSRMDGWRLAPPAWATMLACEDSLARAAYDVLQVSTLTAVVEPRGTTISAGFPNPFNPATTLAFTLAGGGRARLEILDLRGRRVATLLDEDLAAGAHTVVWKPRRQASGVYLARLTVAGATATRRLVLVR